ncbi:anthranilate synthase component I [Helicobacter heilmannii]|uniref:anthranilate synthase n=2 Tax=Helicobacter heilmannii TaxID=35817 RepID=A0A0K2XTZ8_HELHE|nr:anthranilate synthase component I [Helicobacter heilmannii]CCM11689.1 Anthranilate synthase, aminase component [Helicobacter heilmannii ASB1.4]CRF46443.1 Anthranilate synthase, aminase component [Helicobacter heilmannii]CRF50611.1 Anthranilate synthase, aminase component [Helicobacter heilmannii]CRI33829.1 Anthranilate synthase, aminase component [Helicobacter heilmannii]
MLSLQTTAPYILHPLTLYTHLQGANTLLLESAQVENKKHTKSIILARACLKLVCQGAKVRLEALNPNGQALLEKMAKVLELEPKEGVLEKYYPKDCTLSDEFSKLKRASPLDTLRAVFASVETAGVPPFGLFCGGYFGFEFVGAFEDLPHLEATDNTAPDFIFLVAQNLILIDHQAKSTQIFGACFKPSLKAQIQAEIEALARLNPPPFSPKTSPQDSALDTNCSDEGFAKMVLATKEQIKQGEIFQAVPSRSFYMECKEPLSAYHHLKEQNPSPYMFYMQTADFTLFGASPESALKYDAPTNLVQIYPIAGTRPRGKNPDGSLDLDLDNRLELDLQNDPKERAEHIMLVDLARNDIARVAKPLSRVVSKLLKVEKYAHVMHLTSAVQGELKEGLDALHAYQSFMNAGTLSGAPKIAALKLIAALEGKRRGSYGGSMGYLCADGSMDSCIIIRSAFVQKGRAVVQTGAGIVLDSVAQAEIAETKAKAKSVISAILKTHT